MPPLFLPCLGSSFLYLLWIFQVDCLFPLTPSVVLWFYLFLHLIIFLCCLVLSNFLWLQFLICRLQECSSCCLPPGWIEGRGLCRLPSVEDWKPAHWWVELGLVFLVVDRDVSGSIGLLTAVLRTTLSNLSADAWSCRILIPLLVVWLETSQNWSQPPVEAGQSKRVMSRTAATSVLVSWWFTPPSTRDHQILAGEFWHPWWGHCILPWFWKRDLMYTLQKSEFQFPLSVLWKFLQSNPYHLLKANWPGSSSHCQTPKLGTLTGSEFSFRWENWGGMIIFQFRVTHLAWDLILSDYGPPTISLWLLLCLLDVGYLFW